MGWIKRKEAELFANQVEEALDTILSGRELREPEEVTEDTLWGKCGEKFWQLSQVWNVKEAEALREKKQMKSFISDISHQTKIPLANMKLYQEFLQEEELSEKGREFLRRMEEQTEKLDFLLQSMVKMSRLENGIIQIKKEKGKLQETLTAAVSQIVPAATKKEMTLRVSCDPDLLLNHDRKWTEEAIFNVLDNAVKYTDPKGSIEIQVIPQEIFTKISIRDNGKGILPERQAEIFTRFYREPEVHDNHGVGIGLYLTRKILELQNGYIEVRSEAGKGSEFCLYLPN
ncbi:MAG: HAMP domain-containing sensor histidine kinase [Eubacteriales bacterium]|nr:HAMP domain-containing sensor histidine kinase [Eubacteriales bacterium]